MCRERERENGQEDLEEWRMERDALKDQQQIRHINERIMSSIEPVFGMVTLMNVEGGRTVRYPVCYFDKLK